MRFAVWRVLTGGLRLLLLLSFCCGFFALGFGGFGGDFG
jgi:hypothetical protein